VSMPFSPLMAINPNQLPSGGKFTHGTSGSISGPYFDKNTGKNTIDITGKTQGGNHVIQWGGGFNIGNKAQVNFKGSDQNYLNIAHGTSKSTIEGVLNAKGNNVFLINPNGVIITKTGTINANRFVASTSSMDSKSMQEFADGKLAYNTFSPVFKPNGGNVVNMGTINAKNITLQGNKVMLSADTSWDDKNNKIKLNQITADNIDLKGNEVYVDISTINSNNLTTEAKNKGIAYLSATGYYYNPARKYNDIVFTTKGNMDKTYNQYISIGSDLDWWHFAKGWNENKEGFRDTASEYRLTNDIDFKASSGQNYANYWVDLNGDGKKDANEFTNMIVGYKGLFYTDSGMEIDSTFNKTFDGQGYTLKNINIDTTGFFYPGKYNLSEYVGIFGKADGAKFKNINVDYKNGGINASNEYVGGFAGYIDGFVDGVSLKNINYINNNVDITLNSGYMTYYGTGGFVGDANGVFRNIYLDNIQNINVKANLTDNSKIPDDGDWWYDPRTMLNYGVGGFAGTTFGIFENIHIKNSGNFELSYETNKGNKHPSYGIGVGGFTGNATNGIYDGILLQNIKDIKAVSLNNSDNSPAGSTVGGFAGKTSSGSYKNIYIDKLENIYNYGQGVLTGGFAGYIDGGDYYAISLNDIKKINGVVNKYENYFSPIYRGYTGGFAGMINIGVFSNININDIKEIYTFGDHIYSGGFAGYIGSNWNANIVDPIFNDIVISNIGTLKADAAKGEYTGAHAGGFAGYINSGKFNNISTDHINNIIASSFYSSFAGGFAGYISNGSFGNISINTIGDIKAQANDTNAYDDYKYAGGFAGVVSSGEFNKISIKDITEVNADDVGGGFAGKIEQSHASGKAKAIYENIKIEDIDSIAAKNYTGGFAGEINAGSGKFKNITINNIDQIKSTVKGGSYASAYAGGFAGSIINTLSSEFSFIALNNIENITANLIHYDGFSYAGGFAGLIYGGKFNNISLNHIQNIKSTYTPNNNENKWFAKQVYAGGFVGATSSGIFENISIYDVKNIHAINNAQYHGSDIENGGNSGSYAGGFAGYIHYDNYSKPKFNNIYMYFIPNSIIKLESKLNEIYAGKFVGMIRTSDNETPNISNIYIYH
ncbi:TPA: filamentous hemagglutinin N-terminal domain-containing protein, partial [Campylobacter lari]|nr:filamentous hemagglutinin N-terminal domain-containing protein [Campylobacter lari]